MRPIFSHKNLLIWILSISFLSFQTEAAIHPKQQQAEEIIHKLYHTLSHKPSSSMPQRLNVISAQFLGSPYLLGALGEGIDAQFDQAPQYRADAFDCDTYVTTVLALALANNTSSFKQCLAKVRYKDGKVDYISRNHFTSLDWNPNNQKQGFIRDITLSIKDQKHKPVALIASAEIDRPSWYEHLSEKTIRLLTSDPKEHAKRLKALKSEGGKLSKEVAKIPYLPLSSLFDAHGRPNTFLFSQIPDASIIEIVRPNWNVHEKIGTNLNVSHLGFAFRKQGKLYFRQASSQLGKVVDVPLVDYLKEKISSPTIKGINVEIVVPGKPVCE